MIEILFGESEAGSMKCAKSRNKIEKANDGPTSLWGNPDLISKQEDWIPVYGTAAEVICLCSLLDVGDIKKPFHSEYRTDLILDMYTQSGWDTSEEYINELRREITGREKEYERLWKLIEAGEPLRIWYSSAPYSLCGFYWLCHELRKVQNDIYVVKLPEHEQTCETTIIEYQNWGEIMHEKMSTFLPLQKQLSDGEIRMYGQKWAELVEDNSPLRAIINGQLVGVPEDFYDSFILKELTEKPVKEARLIGNLLGKYRFSIGDWWYAKRIDYLIQDGRIRIVEDCEQKYRRTICLAGQRC